MSRITSEDFAEILPETQYPIKQTICSIVQWKQNWKCILLTASIVLCLISGFWCHQQITNQVIRRKEIHCNENTRWLLILSTIILYSLYLMECSHATDNIQLCSYRTENIHTVNQKIDHMKNALPVIWWKATCYHYERKKRRTTQYRRGTYFVATRIYQERVNSVSASSSFNYAYCGMKDISNTLLINSRCAPVIKFRFSKGFAFANMSAASEFEAQRTAFFQELQRYDEHMEVHEGLDLTDYASFQEEQVVLNTTAGRRPWFANPFYYWMYSCCLLSWPFRLILLYNTAYVHYKITKLFGTNYNAVNCSNESGLYDVYNTFRMGEDDELTPLSVGDSEMAGRNFANTTLAPSYSEALLIDEDHIPPEQRSVAGSISSEILNKNLTSNPIGSTRLFYARELATQFQTDDSPTARSDNPPTYEEALMLPILRQQSIEEEEEEEEEDSNSISPFSSSISSNGVRSNRYEIRLPNPRTTFLSIETSL